MRKTLNTFRASNQHLHPPRSQRLRATNEVIMFRLQIRISIDMLMPHWHQLRMILIIMLDQANDINSISASVQNMIRYGRVSTHEHDSSSGDADRNILAGLEK